MNIHVKIEGKRIIINYALVYSPLEKFTLENIENASSFLTDLYHRIGQVVIKRSIAEISEEIDQELQCIDYMIDVDRNKFQVVLGLQSEL